MFQKIFLIAVVFAVVFQLIVAETKSSSSKIDTRVFADINGTSYFIDTSIEYRDEAQTSCHSLNMTLITFETPGKYAIITDWLMANGYDTDWFWTGALRDANSTRWYWEPTGNDITEFFWGEGQPTMNDDLIRTCIDFRAGGYDWDDDDGDFYVLGKICQ